MATIRSGWDGDHSYEARRFLARSTYIEHAYILQPDQHARGCGGRFPDFLIAQSLSAGLRFEILQHTFVLTSVRIWHGVCSFDFFLENHGEKLRT